jgi:hypothetical protein
MEGWYRRLAASHGWQSFCRLVPAGCLGSQAVFVEPPRSRSISLRVWLLSGKIPAASTGRFARRLNRSTQESKESVCARKYLLNAIENTAAAVFVLEHSEIPPRAPRRRMPFLAVAFLSDFRTLKTPAFMPEMKAPG